MASSPATSYDAFRYPGRFYPQATPDRLATIATLYGLQPAPIENARILELGCGEGANVMTVAYALPDSRVYGVDRAPSVIERAQANARELGITNVAFRALDLMEFPAEAGEFDYIISHGVYSWVPEPVRAKMLEICARHLAPNGLAYISYNAMPGGLMRAYARDLMLFHTREITDPVQKVREARGVVNFAASGMNAESLEAAMLNPKSVDALEDSFIYHDLLVEEMQEFYIVDFVRRAAAAGLQYVGEANPMFLMPGPLPEEVNAKLASIPDRLAREQYLDFIQCRRFRQTILCRAGRDIELRVTPERMRPLSIAGGTWPAEPVGDLHDGREVPFRVPNGVTVKCNEAVPKALFCVLGESWPRSFHFDELKQAVFERAGEPVNADTEAGFAAAIVRCFARGLIYLRCFEARMCATPSEHPRASAVAQWWSKQGPHVPAMTLSVWEVEEPELRELLLLLDGESDYRQLAEEMSRRLGTNVTAEQVEKGVARLAGFGLLVS